MYLRESDLLTTKSITECKFGDFFFTQFTLIRNLRKEGESLTYCNKVSLWSSYKSIQCNLDLGEGFSFKFYQAIILNLDNTIPKVLIPTILYHYVRLERANGWKISLRRPQNYWIPQTCVNGGTLKTIYLTN